MRALHIVVVAGAILLGALPGRSQTLLHRYSFNGNANDSVGTANGVVVGNVTFLTAPGVNGSAVFAGGTSGANPGYIKLPNADVSGLQNATIEVFTTNFNIPKDVFGQAGGKFQALFAVGSAFGNQTNYAVLSPNRDGSGVGIGARANNYPQVVLAGNDPLPIWRGNHVVHLLFSRFSGIGSIGVQTIYVDGVKVAEGPTIFSLARVAAGTGGIATVGIGGGSPFNDPTFSGSMCEFRIYAGALSPAQIAADLVAGPSALGFTPANPPYSFAEATRALQIAAGLGAAPTGDEVARLNVETNTGSPTAVDIYDALRVAREAANTNAMR